MERRYFFISDNDGDGDDGEDCDVLVQEQQEE